ncbi:hypothetical protein [Priestia flexa]|nr:hypothetical protein [Priestia flexa]QCS54155.1 hypothetical protein FED53_16940 [Priestia flexa]
MLRTFIKQIDKEGGVWKAKEKFVEGYVGEERNKELKKFSDLLNKVRGKGVNPVSLQDEYGLVKLKNLKPQINDRISDLEMQLGQLDISINSVCEVR